jgi:hypothetical protein
MDLAAGETGDPSLDRRGSGIDPAARDLTAVAVQRVERDLGTVNIEPGEHRHRSLLPSLILIASTPITA